MQLLDATDTSSRNLCSITSFAKKVSIDVVFDRMKTVVLILLTCVRRRAAEVGHWSGFDLLIVCSASSEARGEIDKPSGQSGCQ